MDVLFFCCWGVVAVMDIKAVLRGFLLFVSWKCGYLMIVFNGASND